MNPQSPKNRLRQVEKALEQERTLEQTHSTPAGHEFASVEEMLRQDAAQTPPPPSIWERLKKNLDKPIEKPSWWRRWFS